MHPRSAVAKVDVLIGVVIVAALLLGTVALFRMDTWGERGDGMAEQTDAELQRLRKIDPAWIRYRQTSEIPVAMKDVRALAVGPGGWVYVAGDRAVHAFDLDGRRLLDIALAAEPTCLAVGGSSHDFPGRVYVGADRHVELFDAEGTPLTAWDDLGEKAVLTSLALAEHDVFVADAGNKLVWHYDTSGTLLGRIGEPDQRRNVPGLAVPSPYLDVAVGADGLLRVVNPGALRLETYTFDGGLELAWQKQDDPLAGFFGCCNPVHVALLADGQVVTAEKGLPRIKVYKDDGTFVCVVAGPEQLDVVAADLAVDSDGRVLALDPEARCVRVFQSTDGE